MPYSELLIRPMREDLTRIGVEETRTPEQVEDAIRNTQGTLLVVVNSVCGCAAGKARPGVAIENKHAEEIAQELTQAFDQHCAPAGVQ